MARHDSPVQDNDAFWQDYLTHGSRKERAGRRVFRLIPHGPRCKLCAAPFGGLGAPLMQLIGKRPSGGNPNMCSSCFDFMSAHHGGAEVEVSLLFADVRGSTTLAEGMSPKDFHGLMDRFYDVATNVVVDHDGFVDKFVGDELVAIFFPLLTGPRHAARAVEAALALLRATGHGEPQAPWAPVGAGVHTGLAWVGAVGSKFRTDFTALGDTVNTTARLAATAGLGEVLVTAQAADAAELDAGLERRSLELKGKHGIAEVVTLTVAGEATKRRSASAPS